MDFSLIVPCYNEAQNVRTFFATATECLDAADMAYELVFVDDGSSDGTMAVVRAEIDTYRLMRPFGRGSFTVVRPRATSARRRRCTLALSAQTARTWASSMRTCSKTLPSRLR